MKYLDPNYDDTIVVFVRMINTRVKRVMIDIGSFANILYLNTFKKFRLLANDLTPMTSLLMGFTSNSISPLRTISLYAMFDDNLVLK